MALDLTQFHGVFFEESFEALDSMEAALLKLDVGAPALELINTIFRVAHSIKGGSATFGFTAIASFTHSLETVLDEMRAGRTHVTTAISNLLLKSVDVMRNMLRAVQANQPIDAQQCADLQFDLELLMANPGAMAAAPAVDDLLGQQQVVVKSLEPNYGRVDGVSGATILGDGSVALILDLNGLIRTAAQRAAASE
jgi:two-component system chemotaxis sensor kinase CheA